ncbi:uncharacterized protein LOC120190114 [Hibiscus syriacus]|uniref:uncharacterized protein LOC120190114 n=1 Tax=Hibiscus syriacus TaxID=106335 RepID=UPI00192247B7|nr:uncharacterized protein LOC120190114 [Hibiscus syriacus]
MCLKDLKIALFVHESRLKQPPEGWIKANVDAVVNTSDGLAAVCGVLRNEDGEWIFDFTRSLGRCSVLMDEIWVVRDTLWDAWRLGFRRVEVETDNVEVSCIFNGSSDALEGNALVHDLKDLRNRNWITRMTFVRRVQNGVADRLARMSRRVALGLQEFMVASVEVEALLQKDLSVAS